LQRADTSSPCSHLPAAISCDMGRHSVATMLLLMSSQCFCKKCPKCPQYTGQDIIEEFNDKSVGVAYTMLSSHSWTTGSKLKNFFADAPAAFDVGIQQDMTIATSERAMAPYQADGQYGLLFHIGEKSRFWEYFQVATCGTTTPGNDPRTGRACEGCWCNLNDTIVGGPGDGMINGPYATCRRPIVAAGKDYAWFNEQKQHIWSLYKKVYPTIGAPYNEFDANGMSKFDLAGAMFSPGTPAAAPGVDEEALCNFLRQADPDRQTWPLYRYTWDAAANTNKLELEKELPCSHSASPKNSSAPIEIKGSLALWV